MFTVEFTGVDRVVDRVDELKRRLDGLHQNVPEEFLAWQTENMHRKEPWAATTQRGTSVRVKIILRHHSFKSVKWRATKRAAKRAAARAAHHRAGLRRLAQNTPILRPELFEQLCARMATLLKATITWA